MKRKKRPEQERVERLLDSFSRLPAQVQENVIGYTSGVVYAVQLLQKGDAAR